MSELAVFLSGHLPKGLLEEPFNKIVRVHNSIEFSVLQIQSGRKYPTRVLPECAKYGKGNVPNICPTGPSPVRMLGRSI